MFDYLIVGAGFSGAVLANKIATELDKKILIVEKRNHIGGNAYDYHDENGILIHKYGPHIFHTNLKKVWQYLSRFTDWYNYQHHVLAFVEGKKIPIPFNLNSIYQIFSNKYAEKFERTLVETFGYGKKIPILKLLEYDDSDLKFLSNYIYDNIYYGYTLKQWDLKPEELDASVTSRVPIYISRDDRYFQDVYQGIPKQGYTKLFENLLSHPKIHVLLNTDYKKILTYIKFNKLIYTVSIDEYFDYLYGELPYRSLNFIFEKVDLPYYQETAQINYPNNYNYTRITEFKYFKPIKSENTIVAYEFSRPYKRGVNIPYYPIVTSDNKEILNKYKNEIKKYSSIIILGRLADYKYYNMDQVVARSLNIFKEKIGEK